MSATGRLSLLRQSCQYLLAVAIVFLWPFAPLIAAAASRSAGPLVVDESSPVVVMEF
jgi:hypothetical protein